MKQPLIVLFVGVPGSGKTHFSRKLAPKINAVVFNSDAIRHRMWGSVEAVNADRYGIEARRRNNRLTFGAMDYATEQVITTGQSVIYDCNANKRADRQEKYDIAARHGALAVVVRIRVAYETALSRIQEREEAHDQRRMTAEHAKEVVDRLANEIEEPAVDEQVIDVDGTAPFQDQYQVFQQRLKEIYEQTNRT